MNAATPESVGMSPERLARLDAVFARRIESRELPGVATMVARRGSVVHAHVQGMADIETGKPLAEDTIYHIYSMTKPVTAVALLTLMEEGLFQLDQPAADFIPELGSLTVLVKTGTKPARRVKLARPVTFRHLFTHTSGFCYPAKKGTPVEKLMAVEMGGDDFREVPLTLEQWMKKVVRVPLAHQPGEGWTYGFSIDVLGRLVEVLSGMTFDRFLQRRLFVPLGMPDTSFAVPEEKLPRIATVYRNDGRGGLEKAEIENRGYGTRPAFISGGGGLFSTPRDYIRFAQMLVNGGELEGVRILGRRTVDLMCMSHVAGLPIPPEKKADAFSPGFTFGLGGRVVEDESVGLQGSRGTYSWDGLACTTFFADPREELAALFFTQISTWPPRIHEQFRTLVYQALT
jgi:CubicO group peptidase (beta-lactamase class C family)